MEFFPKRDLKGNRKAKEKLNLKLLIMQQGK
jgi:hypothetical protein